MKAHRNDTHRYTSPGTKVKVICKGQGQISESCFSKDGCFWGISVSQTHLVCLSIGLRAVSYLND